MSQTFQPDKNKLKRNFNRASVSYDEHAFIQHETAKSLVSRLEFIKIQPTRILELGTSHGFTANLLAERYPEAEIIAIDIAEDMVKHAKPHPNIHYACTDAEVLPFASESFDLVVSNLMLQWCALPICFAEVFRVCRVEACFLFSTMGPDSLQEIRQAWASIDDAAHTHEFTDMHDVGDALMKARFTDPVMEMDAITFQYQTLKTLLNDIRGIGAGNIHNDANKALMGKTRWREFSDAFIQHHQSEDGLPLTYEMIYGHAFRPETPNTVQTDETGVAHFPIDYLRRQS